MTSTGGWKVTEADEKQSDRFSSCQLNHKQWFTLRLRAHQSLVRFPCQRLSCLRDSIWNDLPCSNDRHINKLSSLPHRHTHTHFYAYMHVWNNTHAGTKQRIPPFPLKSEEWICIKMRDDSNNVWLLFKKKKKSRRKGGKRHLEAWSVSISFKQLCNRSQD